LQGAAAGIAPLPRLECLLLLGLLGRLPPCLAARGVAASTTTSCGDPHSLDQIDVRPLSTMVRGQPCQKGHHKANQTKTLS
jgi:hypothetical protein